MKSLLILSLTTIVLVACGDGNIDVRYSLSGDNSRQLNHDAVYSTKAGVPGDTTEFEEVGTHISTYSEVTWTRDGDALTMERRYLNDKSKGYHKNSMPLDLAYRVPVIKLFAQGSKVESVRGNEMFVPNVVNNLAIKESFKRQLRDARYQLQFDREEKRRWEITHLLSGKLPDNGNITQLLRSQGRLPIPSVAVDSVLLSGWNRIGKQHCIEYTVFFAEREPFPYFVWEQFAYGTKAGAPYQKFKADTAEYQTQYSVALDPETSILCREREVKTGVNAMVNPETKEKSVFRSYVSVENLYTKLGEK